jgi:HSP90 family molecular chaperone
MATNEESARFEIAAAVVFRLGSELITDVVQALVELVKNSYDADATWCHVTIKTPDSSVGEGGIEAIGEIVVEDDGHGMDADDFKRGWLMIADSPKKAMKDSGRMTSQRGRTPIGDKGLGRLGVQRLGHDVEILSRVADQHTDEYRLTFSWRDFEQAHRLSDVPVGFLQQARSRKRSGTRIAIRDLKDPEQWIGDDARSKLQRSLSELISPFREVQGFSVTVTLDGEDVPIAEITERLRDTAFATICRLTAMLSG